MKSEEKDIIQLVRAEIKRNLEKCNTTHTPKICAMIRTKEGYNKIEVMIISFMISNNLPVGASITQLEMELE